jgi:hypothetical protein
VPATSLEAALAWLEANAEERGDYTITLTGDETIAPQTLSYGGKNVRITLSGGAAERTVSLGSTGSIFTIKQGVTLTLDNNLTLQGRTDNTASLVQVNSKGTLVMNIGSKITGNTASYGGGVYVSRTSNYYDPDEIDGRFTMDGGEISRNTASNGGGVSVAHGTFTMSNGEISGNSASSGGGVYVSSGTFTMDGGEISGNSASSNGGGVCGSISKQSGGVIYGSDASGELKNTAGRDGHAVYVSTGQIRNTTAGSGVTLDSGISGPYGGWEE